MAADMTFVSPALSERSVSRITYLAGKMSKLDYYKKSAKKLYRGLTKLVFPKSENKKISHVALNC